MTDHLLLDHFDEHGCAVLERQDGSTVTVPVEWLPEEALEGHTLRLTLSPDAKSAVIRFEIDHDSSEPDHVNIGA